jgi:hypothetical protein
MQVQAPTLPNRHRAQVVSALAALALAGATFGVVAIATNDDGATQSQQAPVISSRATDGSPILRGSSLGITPVAATRAPAPQPPAGQPEGFHGRLGIARVAATRAPAPQPPAGQPEGFHGH